MTHHSSPTFYTQYKQEDSGAIPLMGAMELQTIAYIVMGVAVVYLLRN